MEAFKRDSTEQNNMEAGSQPEPVLEEFAGRLLTEPEAAALAFAASEEGMGGNDNY